MTIKRVQPDDRYRVVRMKSGAYRIQELQQELIGEDYWKTVDGYNYYVTMAGACAARCFLVGKLKDKLDDETVDQVIDHRKVAVVD